MNVGTPLRRSKDLGRHSKSALAPKLAALFVATTMLTYGLPNVASAQTASFRSVDKNRDGALDMNELVAAFGRAGALRLLSKMDRNRDGRITIPELRAGDEDDRSPSKGSGGRDDDDDDDDDNGGGGDGDDGDDGDDD